MYLCYYSVQCIFFKKCWVWGRQCLTYRNCKMHPTFFGFEEFLVLLVLPEKIRGQLHTITFGPPKNKPKQKGGIEFFFVFSSWKWYTHTSLKQREKYETIVTGTNSSKCESYEKIVHHCGRVLKREYFHATSRIYNVGYAKGTPSKIIRDNHSIRGL